MSKLRLQGVVAEVLSACTYRVEARGGAYRRTILAKGVSGLKPGEGVEIIVAGLHDAGRGWIARRI